MRQTAVRELQCTACILILVRGVTLGLRRIRIQIGFDIRNNIQHSKLHEAQSSVELPVDVSVWSIDRSSPLERGQREQHP